MNTIDLDVLAFVSGGMGPRGGMPPGGAGGGGGAGPGGGGGGGGFGGPGGGGLDFDSIAKSSPSDWQPRPHLAQPGGGSSAFPSNTPTVQGGPDQSWKQGLNGMFSAMGM